MKQCFRLLSEKYYIDYMVESVDSLNTALVKAKDLILSYTEVIKSYKSEIDKYKLLSINNIKIKDTQADIIKSQKTQIKRYSVFMWSFGGVAVILGIVLILR